MSELPPRIQELISTPIREKIFKLIDSQKDGFTFQEVYKALEKREVDVSVTSVQNFLKSLSYRGYLKEYTVKDNKTRGRSTIHYKKTS
ncbi:MAG: transcriptional repressor [Cyclobacteriaceae bacterium]